ncbi:MAG: hypothetical protein JXA11_02950 [Phycisphaerae bacterium]|nr:hypothetical protein [Phycisphaerae bacterium]
MKIHPCEVLQSLCLLWVGCFLGGCARSPSVSSVDPTGSNQALRDVVISQLRDRPVPAEMPASSTLARSGGWRVTVKFYVNGQLQGEGEGSQPVLVEALDDARKTWEANAHIDRSDAQAMRQGRFYVTLQREGASAFSVVEFQGKGLEVVGDLVAVRKLDTDRLDRQVEAGRDYLLRILDKDKYAFFKRFDATTGAGGARLRTIYTASSLYTLLKRNRQKKNPELEELLPRIAGFLLSMQSQGPEHRGAFYYSLNKDTGEKEPSFVVGTASKTIFTLLELYRDTKNAEYLASAKEAGDWLLSMRKPDGTIVNSVRLTDGRWVKNEKFSTLYLGQVVSALSRLYGVTKDRRYLQGAEAGATVLLRRAEKMNDFLRDDFRAPADPIPTTWAVQSLLDFHKITNRPDVRDVCLRCARAVLARQHTDPSNIADFGRFEGTHATSGNGWILEVFMELYRHAADAGWPEREPFRAAAIRVARWLVQNAYSPENTYFLPHGTKAVGGFIRSYREESVRTDAVCHGINGLMLLRQSVSPGVLLTVPETVSLTRP